MNLQTTVSNTQKHKKRIDAWRGLNMSDSARDGEMTQIRNLCTDDYPTIKTRKPRSVIPGYDGMEISDVYNADGHLVVVADGMLYYDGDEMLAVGNSKKQFALVNTQLVIWPDKVILDLNDGNATPMEAYVIGTARIDADGSNISFSPGGAIEHGTKTYTHLYGSYYNKHVFKYDSLEWTEGSGFSYDRRLYVEAVGLGVGDRFIPALTGGLYAPRFAQNNTDYDDLTGSIYGVVLSKEAHWYNYDMDYESTITYAIYDAAGGTAIMTETFENGETVRLEGFIIKANNKKSIQLTGVTNTILSFDEGSLISSAYYIDVEEPIPPGKAWIKWTHEEGGTTYVTEVGNIVPQRTIRAGEQIIITGGEVMHAQQGYDYIDTNNCKAYAYDPETRVLEELEFMSDHSYYMRVLACDITLPEDENENVVIRREIPDFAYICEHENRLWGVSNEETETIYNAQTGQYNEVKSRVIFGSALGQPKHIYEYKGTATDAYAVAVGGNGDFTAICSYGGALLAWKEDLLCKLTGSYPAEYYLRTYKYEGVAAGSEFSLQTINQILYYLSPAGVMAFSGTAPQFIGEQLGLKKLANGISGRGRTHYYLSAEREDGTWLNAVYDVIHGIWSVEAATESAQGEAEAAETAADESEPAAEESAADAENAASADAESDADADESETEEEESDTEEIRIRSMDRFGNHCYAVIGSDLLKMEDDEAEEEITWSAELAYMDEGTFQHKRYTQVSLEVELGEDATFTLQYKDELDQDWTTAQLAWEPVLGERIRRYVIDTKRSARLYIRISGEGYIKLHALEREYSLEAER